MFFQYAICISVLVRIIDSCIPTQQVESCSSCSPIYDTSCQGYQHPSASSYCLTSDEVPITYTLGPVADHSLPANTCSTRLDCPSGTVARVNINGIGYSMGNSDGSPTLTYCSETDGIWHSDVNGYIYDVSAIACQYP
ncbi:hypothetical protein CAEBREN_06617 [Caenorhabditis brenneri]|uniref:C6 domain-containing protein n=1 Tax=Caenorhabditis brenneri TaxID=135651 RepID=G0MPT6_CAEBE|nr:hypothetical protein CAEBREN_06617 [Caenorhabditis brenneri]